MTIEHIRFFALVSAFLVLGAIFVISSNSPQVLANPLPLSICPSLTALAESATPIAALLDCHGEFPAEISAKVGGSTGTTTPFATRNPKQTNGGAAPLSASCPSSGQTYVNYSDFSNTSALCLVDSAMATQTSDGAVVRLTNNGSEDGEVWNYAKENVTNFYTTFSFRITSIPTYPIGDGLTFAIQNDAVTANGVGGGGIGYEGITDSLVIEFDTYPNTGSPVFDPNNNHMAVQSCGTAANSRNHQAPPNGCLVALFPTLTAPDGSALTMSDGAIHHVAISYTQATHQLIVNLDGFQASATIDLISTLALSDNMAWVGFTGATFTAAENCDLLNWTFASTGRAGVESVGLYNSSTGLFSISDISGIGIDYVFTYGKELIDQPIFGDWLGGGTDTVGVFRTAEGQFYLRYSNTTGVADTQFVFGMANDSPLVGRWNSTAIHDGIGVFRPSNGMVYLKNALSTGVQDYPAITLGIPGDQAVAGDWNGDGVDGIGVYRATTGKFILQDYPCGGTCSSETFNENVPALTSTSSHPAAGNWTYLGRTGVSIYDPTTGVFYLRNELSTGGVDTQLQLLTGTATPGLAPISGQTNLLRTLCHITSINAPGPKLRFQPDIGSSSGDQNWPFSLLNGTPVISTPNSLTGLWLYPPEFTATPTPGTSYQLPIAVNGYVGVIPWLSSTAYQWYQVSVTVGQGSLGHPFVGYIAYDSAHPIFVSDCGTKYPNPQSMPLPQVYPQSVAQVTYVPATFAVSGVVSLFGTNMPPANVGAYGFHSGGSFGTPVAIGTGASFDVVPRNIEYCIDSGEAKSLCDPSAGTRIQVFAPVPGCVTVFNTTHIVLIDLDCNPGANTPTPAAHRYISLTHLTSLQNTNGTPGQLVGYMCSATEMPTSCAIATDNIVHVAFNMYQQVVPGNGTFTPIPQTLVPGEVLGILAQPGCTYNDFGTPANNTPVRLYTPMFAACP